jgi:multiple sugar transport system permease protein
MGTLILITAWWSYPQAMIFFMGALQMIPVELKESLQLDGGGAWASFRYITVPFMRNTAVTVVMILIMLYLQMVTIMLVTTRGGPLSSTETLSLRIYNQMFVDFDMTGAAASALFLFAINIVLTIIVVKLRHRDEV